MNSPPLHSSTPPARELEDSSTKRRKLEVVTSMQNNLEDTVPMFYSPEKTTSASIANGISPSTFVTPDKTKTTEEVESDSSPPTETSTLFPLSHFPCINEDELGEEIEADNSSHSSHTDGQEDPKESDESSRAHEEDSSHKDTECDDLQLPSNVKSTYTDLSMEMIDQLHSTITRMTKEMKESEEFKRRNSRRLADMVGIAKRKANYISLQNLVSYGIPKRSILGKQTYRDDPEDHEDVKVIGTYVGKDEVGTAHLAKDISGMYKALDPSSSLFYVFDILPKE